MLKEEFVIIESPYKGDNWKATNKNLEYARKCMRDCLISGEFPFASHLLYTQEGILDDKKTDERCLGINAGLAWGECAGKTVVYTDLGISEGMKLGIKMAKKLKRKVEFRKLY